MSGSLGVFRPVPVRGRVRAALGGLLIVVMAVSGVSAASLFWLPRSIAYLVENGGITVVARYSVFSERRQIAAEAIQKVRLSRVGRGRRESGVALPGFCVGVFAYGRDARAWQAGNCATSGVLVTAQGEAMPLLLTPADPRQFRETVAARGSGQFNPRQLPPGQGWLLLKLGALVPFLLVPLVAALFFVAPGKLRYVVTPTALLVHSLLRTRSFPLRGASVKRCRPQSTLRLWGSGLPGYFTGVFRLDGESARVYATSMNEGMLVAGEGVRVFVTPEDPVRFLEALRQAGAKAVDAPDA